MEEEDISTTLDPSLPQGPGWRADLSRADRIKVCKLIVQKLHCTFSRSTFLFLWFEAIVSSMVFFSFCRELTVYFLFVLLRFRKMRHVVLCIVVYRLCYLPRPCEVLHNKKVPLEALRDVASRFEANTLRTTGSRKEYIKSIGYALINAEKQLKQNSPENADKKQKQTAGTSAAGRTKRCPKRPRSG